MGKRGKYLLGNLTTAEASDFIHFVDHLHQDWADDCKDGEEESKRGAAVSWQFDRRRSSGKTLNPSPDLSSGNFIHI